MTIITLPVDCYHMILTYGRLSLSQKILVLLGVWMFNKFTLIAISDQGDLLIWCWKMFSGSLLMKAGYNLNPVTNAFETQL